MLFTHPFFMFSLLFVWTIMRLSKRIEEIICQIPKTIAIIPDLPCQGSILANNYIKIICILWSNPILFVLYLFFLSDYHLIHHAFYLLFS